MAPKRMPCIELRRKAAFTQKTQEEIGVIGRTEARRKNAHVFVISGTHAQWETRRAVLASQCHELLRDGVHGIEIKQHDSPHVAEDALEPLQLMHAVNAVATRRWQKPRSGDAEQHAPELGAPNIHRAVENAMDGS